MSDPQFTFGQRVVNIWASADNPHRVGFFVRRYKRESKLNRGWWNEVTDGKGDFWSTSDGGLRAAEAGE